MQERDSFGHEFADRERYERDDQHDHAIGEFFGVPGQDFDLHERA